MKIKTRSSFKKRFKVTGSGKVRSDKASHNHLLMQKSKKQKNLAKNGKAVSDSDLSLLKRAMPGKIRRKKIKVDAQAEETTATKAAAKKAPAKKTAKKEEAKAA